VNPTADYVELAVTSNFSFLRGASHPEELVARAAELGHPSMGIADRQSLAGVVRAHVAAKAAGIRLHVGCRLLPEDGPGLLVYPQNRAAYGRLARLLTTGKRRTEKGKCRLEYIDLTALGAAQTILFLPPKDRKLDDILISKINILKINPHTTYFSSAALHGSAGPPACPWLPSTMFTCMGLNAGRFWTCSPASGRNALSVRRDCSAPPMANIT
jgi:hypothetical protein